MYKWKNRVILYDITLPTLRNVAVVAPKVVGALVGYPRDLPQLTLTCLECEESVIVSGGPDIDTINSWDTTPAELKQHYYLNHTTDITYLILSDAKFLVCAPVDFFEAELIDVEIDFKAAEKGHYNVS